MDKTASMQEWLKSAEGKVFRYLVYKKMFTPYEQQNAFMDEDQYDDNIYNDAVIVRAIDLGYGKWMLALRQVIDGELTDHVEYHQLDDIRLEYFGIDQPQFAANDNKNISEEFAVDDVDDDEIEGNFNA